MRLFKIINKRKLKEIIKKLKDFLKISIVPNDTFNQVSEIISYSVKLMNILKSNIQINIKSQRIIINFIREFEKSNFLKST